MPSGRVMHQSIAASPSKSHECLVGWATHYSIGIGLAAAFAMLIRDGWLATPTLMPALVFGLATVAIPFLTMQPAFGLGIAASRTNNPKAARLKSLSTHAAFGLGLYASASLLRLLGQ
jgi:hypothetical protein